MLDSSFFVIVVFPFPCFVFENKSSLFEVKSEEVELPSEFSTIFVFVSFSWIIIDSV